MDKDLKKKKSDYLLELALEEELEHDSDMEKYKDDEIENSHIFSDGHNKRMKRIFKMAARVENRELNKRKNYKIAAAAAVILCLSTVTVTRVEAFRLPIVRFFMEIKEQSTFFGLQEKKRVALSDKFQRYEPMYIPEGYVVIAAEEDKNGFYIGYENEKEKRKYTYSYWKKTEGMDVDTEDATTIEKNIGGNLAVVVQKGGEVRINIDIGTQRFYLDGTISYEEAVKVMESVNY